VNILKLTVIAALLLALAQNSLAQSDAIASFPDHSVRIVVTYPPGGAGDSSARIVGAGLEKQWKQPVVIENRPGGFQVIGVDAVRRATPNGYTLLIAGGTLSYEHLVNKDIDYQPIHVIAPIGILTGGGLVYTLSANVPANNLAEFIAYAKKNPGKVNEGQSGGTPPLQDNWKQLGVTTVKVPYKGGAQAITALLAGEVDIYCAATVDILPYVKSGRIKPIAYTDRQRHPLLPDVPTFAEATGTDAAFRFWFGLFGPLDLPPALVSKINATANEALRSPDVRDRIRALGLDVFPGSPEDMRQAIDRFIKETEEAVAHGYKIR